MNDMLLTSAEMLTFNTRLAILTDGRLAVGPAPINRSQARALWAATKAFGHVPVDVVVLRSPRRRKRDLLRTGAVVALSAAALSGCTTLGGNVKGNFACRAPDGMCAPTSKIDDQALAMISGGDGEPTPTGVIDPNYRADPRLVPTTASAHLARSSEKVLRIVFPAHIDRLGRYREASAIHAVVERGSWVTASDRSAATEVGMARIDYPQMAMVESTPNLSDMAAASPEVAFPQSFEPTSVATTSPALAPAVAPTAASVAAARRKGKAEKAHSAVVRTSMITNTIPARATQAPVAPAVVVPKAAVWTQAASMIPLRVQATSTWSATPRSVPAVQAPPLALASAKTVPAYDLRGSKGLAPLDSIKDQVGAILASKTVGKGATPAKSATVERPTNGPSVLAVSGVEK
jgi:conjugal transfer pilus assembly protein TraV